MRYTRTAKETALPVVLLCLAGSILLAGCSSTGTQSNSTAPQGSSTATQDDLGVSSSDDLSVGELYGKYGSNPTTIGEYMLLTQELASSENLACYDDPLKDYVNFQDNGGDFTHLVYVTAEGIGLLREAGSQGPCSVVDAGLNKLPGVIGVTINVAGNGPPETEPNCTAGEVLAGCLQMLENNVRVSVDTAVAESDQKTQWAFLSQFLQAYVNANPFIGQLTQQG